MIHFSFDVGFSIMEEVRCFASDAADRRNCSNNEIYQRRCAKSLLTCDLVSDLSIGSDLLCIFPSLAALKAIMSVHVAYDILMESSQMELRR